MYLCFVGSAKSIVRSGKGKQSLSSSTQNAKKRQQIHQEEESAHSEPGMVTLLADWPWAW